MERGENEQKANGRFTEILRCMLYAVLILFFVSCIAFLFWRQHQINKRLAAIDDKMDKFEWKLKNHFPTHQYVNNDRIDRLDAKALLTRKKRASTLSLQSLEKRLKVLELRLVTFLSSLKNNNVSFCLCGRGRRHASL